ncbi:MAG: metallophosphoesterase family protein [Candidatus Bipolaricaulota bacterium]|nr:MAG: metallophosphoesterase family protein [Candidatus Bipolaricaulota bacterium]
MKIAVLTDAHANLPALEAALAAIARERCDLIVHTGDAIAIGPYPRETVELLLSLPQIECLVGNHEALLLDGLPDPLPEWISSGEAEHQRWTHTQLGAVHREAIGRWKMTIDRRIEDVDAHFAHYGLDPRGERFAPFAHEASREALDRVFSGVRADIVFFGHQHTSSDVHGRARYVNPGSLGCHTVAEARFCIAQFPEGEAVVEAHAVPYDDAPLIFGFMSRAVPERAFIDRTFFGNRLGIYDG